jgi:hypothetical protein
LQERLERDGEFGAEELWGELQLELKVLRMRVKVFVMFVQAVQPLMVPGPRRIGDQVQDVMVRVVVQPSFDGLD